MIAPPTSAGPPAFRFKASRQPLLLAAIAYAPGIIAGVHAWRPALWWFLAGTMFVAPAGYSVRRRSFFAWSLALGAFFLAGAVHIQVSEGSRLDTSIQP